MHGTINLARSEPWLDASNLDALIQRWLDDRAQHLDSLTLTGYIGKINHFRRWWAYFGPLQDWKLTRADLLRFREHLESYALPGIKPMSYNQQKDILRRLRQVFNFAATENYTPHYNYASWVPAPRGSAPLRQAATLDAIAKLIDATRNQSYHPRDQGIVERDLAIIALLLGTGMRRAECAALHVEDIQIDADGSGIATLRKAKRVKNRDIQQRSVAFDSHTGTYLAAWLDHLQRTAGPLFISFSDNGRGTQLSPQGVYKVIKSHIITAGVKAEIMRPCHDLRVAFATYWERHRKGQAYNHLLSKQLGHSDYRMTTAYSRLDVEDIRQDFISPLALLGEK